MEIVEYNDPAGRVPFRDWLESLGDRQARAKIRARLERVAAGNLGDRKALRAGVIELKVDFGPG